MTLQFSQSSSASTSQNVMLNPLHNQVKIVHISQWDRAFAIYSYALLKAHPEDSQGLVLYGNLIKDLAFKGHNWANYDRKFRRLKEREPSKYPWGCTELTLYAESINTNRSSSQTLGPRKSTYQNNQGAFRPRGGQPNREPTHFQGRPPIKKCFAFNKGFCKFDPCRFAHICSKCGGQHSATNCWKW